MILSTDPARGPENNTFPAALNTEFNKEEDNELLASTNEHCYWWKEEHSLNVSLPQITRHDTFNHFVEFYNNVSELFMLYLDHRY